MESWLEQDWIDNKEEEVAGREEEIPGRGQDGRRRVLLQFSQTLRHLIFSLLHHPSPKSFSEPDLSSCLVVPKMPFL